MNRRIWIIALIGVAVVALGTCVTTYNRLVRLDQGVEAQWAQVQSAYQRRADLVPNLVATVKGAAKFEQDTIVAVTQARAKVGSVAAQPNVTTDPAKFREFQQAQDQLGGAMSRLLVVAEAYPQLNATQAFRDLMAQLEGTENRISVERMRYNDAAREYNTARSSFPTSIIAAIFASKFPDKQYFTAAAGSETAPKVTF